MILEELTKEYMVEKRLFPYIPFYIARYEKEIATEKNIEDAIRDLTYFRNQMVRLYEEGELSDDELIDLKGFVNTIIIHITNGNENEERLVNVMGGTVIETESERLRREGREAGRKEGRKEGREAGRKSGREAGGAEQIIKMGQEFGLDDADILKRLQEQIGLTLEKATAYLAKYRKHPV